MANNTLRIVSPHWVSSNKKKVNVVFHCINKNCWWHITPLSESRAKIYVQFSSYKKGDLWLSLDIFLFTTIKFRNIANTLLFRSGYKDYKLLVTFFTRSSRLLSVWTEKAVSLLRFERFFLNTASISPDNYILSMGIAIILYTFSKVCF
jgi:hypothetical protein